MRRFRVWWTLALLAPAVLLLACGSNKSNNTANNAAASATVAPSATLVAGGAQGTPIPAVASPAPPRATPAATAAVARATVTPAGTPPVGVPNPCITLSNGPVPPNATLAPPTPIPAFTPGAQPVRPAVDFSKLATPPGIVPQGWIPLNDGRFDAANVASVAPYPQTATAYLQTIGLLGGRVQSWTGPASDGRFPLLALQYFAFDTDAGASAFLHNPVDPAQYCVKQEQGASLGMETSHTSFQYSGKLQSNKDGLFEGQTVLWRCGRVLLSVQQVGAPGQFSPGSVDEIAKKVQQQFVKTNPCS